MKYLWEYRCVLRWSLLGGNHSFILKRYLLRHKRGFLCQLNLWYSPPLSIIQNYSPPWLKGARSFWVADCGEIFKTCWILNKHTHTFQQMMSILAQQAVVFSWTKWRNRINGWDQQTNKVFTTSLFVCRRKRERRRPRFFILFFLHQTNDEILQRKDSGPSKNIFFIFYFFPAGFLRHVKAKANTQQ